MGGNLSAHPVRGESHIQRNATGEVATIATNAAYVQANKIFRKHPTSKSAVQAK